MKVVIHETGQGSGREEGQVDMWMGYGVCEWMDGQVEMWCQRMNEQKCEKKESQKDRGIDP